MTANARKNDEREKKLKNGSKAVKVIGIKYDKKDRISAFVQGVVCWTALGVFKILFRFKVLGQENLKEVENGSVIFASNHNSYIDGGIAGRIVERQFVFKQFFR